jgi:hypothetical protein
MTISDFLQLLQLLLALIPFGVAACAYIKKMSGVSRETSASAP